MAVFLYLLSNDVQIPYAKTEGYVPVTLKAQNSDEYRDYLSRCGEDNSTYYDIKIKASKLLLANLQNTFVTPVFNGSASLRDAAGQLIENVTKSVRRKEEIDDAYMVELKKQIIHPEIIKEVADDIKIVYSPFNGTGNVPVRRVLSELGFKNVFVVPEQEMPDPNFTTLDYPNPEDPKAFTLALKLAKEKNADIILATDPDADRLGIYALDTKTGEYVPFTGNMSGMLIAEYILRERTATGTMPENPALVSTIVTTNMAKAIADDYNVKFIEVLTGFKYIGEQIKFFEQSGSNNYVFGLEESYGCLAGTHARDKDAVVAVMCLCEMASWCKKNGLTVWDQMINLYNKYGYYKETQYAITMKGIEGANQIAAIMDNLRNNPPKNFGDLKVKEFRDYKSGETLDIATGTKGSTGLPSSNVLYFELENDSWCCARPSGTEPKIKFYMGVKGRSLEDSKAKVEKLTEDLKAYIQ